MRRTHRVRDMTRWSVDPSNPGFSLHYTILLIETYALSSSSESMSSDKGKKKYYIRSLLHHDAVINTTSYPFCVVGSGP